VCVRFSQVNLKTGTNVLYWRTTGILLGNKIVKPVLLKSISIEGVAYTSECFQCKPGTFSPAAGSTVCQLCPRNTFSQRGASSCQTCNLVQQFSGRAVYVYVYMCVCPIYTVSLATIYSVDFQRKDRVCARAARHARRMTTFKSILHVTRKERSGLLFFD
uniref:UPF0577 protein KIAA1324-like homolog n=1 Tax=Callorhinchus milii TaxID=7868 RepID=A0A4W3GVI7_CALMI